jgi:hypothetical protein
MSLLTYVPDSRYVWYLIFKIYAAFVKVSVLGNNDMATGMKLECGDEECTQYCVATSL